MFIVLNGYLLNYKHHNMNKQISVFCNELLKYVPRHTLDDFSGQLKSDKRSKSFSTWKTFIWLFIWEVLNVDSIRELTSILNLYQRKLYHIGLCSLSRSTFSDRINKINPIIFQNVFYKLLQTVQRTTWWKINDSKIFAIDSTLISLTLTVFDRAKYRTRKGGIKVHTRLDIKDSLPDLLVITEAKVHDNKIMEKLLKWVNAGDVLLFDRWYLDYKLLYKLEQRIITYVTRTKKTTNYCPIKSNEISHPKVQYDKICEFISESSFNKYPEPFRIVRYYVEEKDKEYEYITNNFDLPAEKIAELYKKRREIEELFRRLKQNLKIKQFFWTSRNAVENQIRVAMTYYLMVLLIKKKTNTQESLLELTRRFSTLLFERVNLLYVIGIPSKKLRNISRIIDPPPQFSLFSYI